MDHGLDGIIIYIDQPGRPPVLYAVGWKNKENQIPADPQALFKIASINKLYIATAIATAIAQLVSIQSLSLDDTLADHLPDLVGRIKNAEQITVRMLVQHRSGIPNFTDHDEFDWFVPHTDSNKNLELIPTIQRAGFLEDNPFCLNCRGVTPVTILKQRIK